MTNRPRTRRSGSAKFTELVATAIANTESRAELAASEARARLAGEQAALRRVATLVAEGRELRRTVRRRHQGGRGRPRCACRGPAALRD